MPLTDFVKGTYKKSLQALAIECRRLDSYLLAFINVISLPLYEDFVPDVNVTAAAAAMNYYERLACHCRRLLASFEVTVIVPVAD